MNDINDMSVERFLFGGMLILANQMDTLMERELSEVEMTTKQWFLCVILNHFFSAPPTIKEAAKEMGSSHQNVKQVAMKLEQKGILRLIKDEKDARAIRMILTEKGKVLGSELIPKTELFSKKLFAGINTEDLEAGRRMLIQIQKNIYSIRMED